MYFMLGEIVHIDHISEDRGLYQLSLHMQKNWFQVSKAESFLKVAYKDRLIIALAS